MEPSIPNPDPRFHAERIKNMLGELVLHLREDTKQVSDAKALVLSRKVAERLAGEANLAIPVGDDEDDVTVVWSPAHTALAEHFGRRVMAFERKLMSAPQARQNCALSMFWVAQAGQYMEGGLQLFCGENSGLISLIHEGHNLNILMQSRER